MRPLKTSVWLAALVLSFVVAGSSAAQTSPLHLRFATVGLGSSWYTYAAGIAQLLRPSLPKGSTIDVLPIAGGVANPKMIETGEAELAFSHNVAARWACKGEVAFTEPTTRVRALVGGLDNFFMGVFVSERSGITEIDQINTRAQPFRLLTTPVGGMGEYGVRQILSAYGTSYDGIKARGGSVRHVPRPATVQGLQDGTADAWSHIVNEGHPIVTELTTVTTVRMLPLSQAAVDKLVAAGWAPITVAPNTFKGQTEAVRTVNAPTNILASADLPEPVAYEITKLVNENKAKLVQVHGALSDFDPAKAADPGLTGCPLHAGAERYYREKGLIK